jgi:acetoin utilization deacetylase AcuC-like enzyme
LQIKSIFLLVIALFASGSILELLDALKSGKIDNGIAITRPPGHHANSDTAMFIIFY